jgi:hypothetical protein
MRACKVLINGAAVFSCRVAAIHEACSAAIFALNREEPTETTSV